MNTEPKLCSPAVQIQEDKIKRRKREGRQPPKHAQKKGWKSLFFYSGEREVS